MTNCERANKSFRSEEYSAQAFIATLLVDHSILALPIIQTPKSRIVAWFSANRQRETGFDCRETWELYHPDQLGTATIIESEHERALRSESW